ncbi:MAG: hypothetical protein KGY55_02030 [Candidatus Thermoplasmatota archaeon]|nr:hypothetical protein [Candidatus Thermoplasmatota archaeon]
MKDVAVLLAFVLLLPAVALPYDMGQPASSMACPRPAWTGTDPYFVPGDMTLADDGFHEERMLHVETWYYEALFDGSQSMVFIVTVLSRSDGHTGMAMAGLYLYRHGRLVAAERLITASFTASFDRPSVMLRDQHMVDGYLGREGHLVYDLLFEHNGTGIALHCVNQTRGWMGDMGRGWWLAVPELQITGIVTMDGQSHTVTGTGYHDHNVFSLLNPLLEHGYLDGKMTSEHFSLVWGHILERRTRAHSFAVVSENGDYHPLGPDDVDLTFSSYVWDNGSRIPTVCTLIIHDVEHDITGTIWMNATTMHHIRLPLLRYWRYHVRVTGWLSSPTHHEAIDARGMMEYMRY